MLTQNLGYPRIGSQRELKKACEQYWAGSIDHNQLQAAAQQIRSDNWNAQREAGIDLIPCNDFSFYDQILDMCLVTGCVPRRFSEIASGKLSYELDLYFAMARGYQKDGQDITAMEMTKWFDTNYHYLVPEFERNQQFRLFSEKPITEFHLAQQQLGKAAKPVLVGPVSFLLLGKEKEKGFHRLELLNRILPVYKELLEKLEARGAEWIQFDEPFLVMDLDKQEQEAYDVAYKYLRKNFPHLKLMVATYFECTGQNIAVASSLPVDALHVDLQRCPSQLDDLLKTNFPKSNTILSLGVVDGRNIWINDLQKSLTFIQKAKAALGENRIMIAPSCSLLHTPVDKAAEKVTEGMPEEVLPWLAFARQKLDEVALLKELSKASPSEKALEQFKAQQKIVEQRRTSTRTVNPAVRERLSNLAPEAFNRTSVFAQRQPKQKSALALPMFPTTTIGSFPQTDEVRSMRRKFKNGTIDRIVYEEFLEKEILDSIRWQEEIGMDVLVHGEFERNDMVEYFGEQLAGFAFTINGWVQSYGSRCVKPPVIYGDVFRPLPMTVKWTSFAQSLTKKYMKGMLTGPVTILRWSFVRDDQPLKDTCWQIGLAIRDEVKDLEEAGIRIIQIDEPAIREGLPLRRENWAYYLDWAVKGFRLSACTVADDTQIHTHMCYSEFNDIIDSIAAMDADVITIETSRSQMELLEAFNDFRYPNEIGPGVYDIHSPRVPSVEEMSSLLQKAMLVLPAENIWVNPDCGLKTRHWPETKLAVENMVEAARTLRVKVTSN
jgi:5-methyltetrahydropteroyltriglutamate--homocysteine methyltransferase